MKEVKNLRYAGPYEEIPYKYFMQSLVGLVPKDNGKRYEADISFVIPPQWDFNKFRNTKASNHRELL